MKKHLKFAKGSLEVLPLLIIFCRKKVDSTSFFGESIPNLLLLHQKIPFLLAKQISPKKNNSKIGFVFKF